MFPELWGLVPPLPPPVSYAYDFNRSCYLLNVRGLAGSSKFDWSRTLVTASTPLMVSEDNRDAVAAVVGLQMNYRKFYEHYINATRVCPRDFATSSGTAAAACNLTCSSPVIPLPTSVLLATRNFYPGANFLRGHAETDTKNARNMEN